MLTEVGNSFHSNPVGGEVLQIDKLAVLAPQLLIVAIVLIPIAILLYKKPWILNRMLTIFR